MALSGITAAFQPANAVSSSPLPLDEEGNLEIADPKSLVQKQIIEQVFSKKNADEPEQTPVAPRVERTFDRVELSNQAMELFSRDSGETVVQMPDGSSVKFTYENSQFVRLEQTTQVQSSDPLVLDLDGNGLQLSEVSKGEGVLFDLTGDGIKEKVSWVAPEDGILVYDRNGNGLIDNGRELFGEQNGASDGFAELARFDRDNNGIINRNDPLFADLRVWQDKNQNGISEGDVLKTLSDFGIQKLLYQSDHSAHTVAGNQVTGYTYFGTTAGSGRIGEAWLNYYA